MGFGCADLARITPRTPFRSTGSIQTSFLMFKFKTWGCWCLLCQNWGRNTPNWAKIWLEFPQASFGSFFWPSSSLFLPSFCFFFPFFWPFFASFCLFHPPPGCSFWLSGASFAVLPSFCPHCQGYHACRGSSLPLHSTQ